MALTNFGAMIMTDLFKSSISLSLDSVVHGIGDAIVVADKDYRIYAANDNFAALYGLKPENILGKTAFDIYPDFHKSVFYEAISKAARTGEPSTSLGYSSNTQKWLVARCYKYDEKYYVMVVHNMTGNVNKNAYVSNYDTLTSLPNRFMFEEDMKKIGEFASKTTFILFDLKKFHIINETAGSAVGDMCLMETAARLKQSIHANDNLYRISADQFLIMSNSNASLEEKIKNLKKQFEKPFLINGKPLIMGSYLAVYRPENPERAQHALKYAQLAMNHAKKKKMSLVFFSPEMEKHDKTLEVAHAIKQALAENQFEMFYQPQADILNKKVCGAEALIRWKHPTLGFIPPDKFLPIAEDAGLMLDIDKWVFDRVLKDCRHFKKMGIDVPISINLSSAGFGDAELQKYILQQATFYKPNLCFEITETGFMDFEGSKDFINKLRENNFSIAIDDFGTGYCSLEYLLHYPSNYLKIDRKFVSNLYKIQKNQTIVANIIKLGQSLGICMIAEGVEDETEWMVLKNLNCDIIQGYHFSKPVCVEDFVSFCLKQGLSSMKSTII